MAKLQNYNGRYCEWEFEYTFLALLEEEGWQYLAGSSIPRNSRREVLYSDDLEQFLSKTSPDLTADEIRQVMDTVRLAGAESDFATLHKVYGWMVNGIQFMPQSGLARMVALIDFETPENNIFRAVNQFVVEYTNNGQTETRRPDVLLFVNGMPLCVIELKNPADEHATIYEAWEQINIRYWRDIPHLLIQTISRVNRKYPGKEYGLIVDYIGIRDNMRTALKLYGGDNSIAPSTDDVEQATDVFREELSILKKLFSGYDLKPFLDPTGDPVKRYKLLAKAAEYVFASTQEMNTENNGGKSVSKVSFKKYFLTTVKRMRAAYDICQPSGELNEEESALAQCLMAIAGFVRKMSGTSEVDTETMNRNVAQMVEEALKYNQVESVLENGEQEDIFSPEYIEKLSDVKMPASKLEILVKMLRKQISEYGKTNQMAAKKFQEMLEDTIRQYHERRKHLTAEEAGAAQEETSEEIIKNATEQALQILKEMNADRESFRKVGLTFEEKAFYDILMTLRDQYNFEYGTDKVVDGVSVNDKCKSLAKKIKEIIDTKSSFADWLNNQIVRDQLKFDIKVCLIKNGYPPQYSPEVFRKVMEQVENFEENNS